MRKIISPFAELMPPRARQLKQQEVSPPLVRLPAALPIGVLGDRLVCRFFPHSLTVWHYQAVAVLRVQGSSVISSTIMLRRWRQHWLSRIRTEPTVKTPP